jgi:hypothetical protein
LLLNLNLTFSNGIRIDVADPDNLGPILGFDESLAAISALLDECSQSDESNQEDCISACQE